jgi:hypothetical protein
MKTQHRVVWRREDRPRRTRILIRRETAEKFMDVLRTGDPHYRCDHDSGPCEAVPPLVSGPFLQARTVSEWGDVP